MGGKDEEDKQGPSSSEIVLKGGGAIAGAAAGAAVGGVLGTILGGFLGSAAPDIVSKLFASLRSREERIARSYLETLLKDDSASDDEVRERAERLASNEVGARVIADHMRKLASVCDEALLPALAALGREYTLANQPIDRFFRSVTTFLTSITAEEARTFRAVFEAGMSESAPDPFVVVVGRGQGKLNAVQSGNVSIERIVASEGEALPVQCDPLSIEALSELRRTGIARDGYGGYLGVTSGPNVAVVQKSAARRLAAFLRWVR